MRIIADSGSTKTDWRLLSPDGQVQQLRTTGLNPYFHSHESVQQEIRQHVLPAIQGEVTEVFFYGSGCGTESSCQLLKAAFQELLPTAEIAIHDDLLGAARAACGHSDGIACILGTGSNSAMVRGGEIVARTPANGIWLGDEGSGGYLGKQLIIAYLNGELPKDLHQRFEKRYPDRRPDILERVYRQERPNLYLAQFARFLFHNLQHPYCYRLVFDAFCLFFEKTVCTYENYREYPVHSVGSIGFYYVNVLRKAAAEKGVFLKNVLETPIAGLTLFHQEA
jgi:N-acetylglucosamine kinase-like BadF-type ATPase